MLLKKFRFGWHWSIHPMPHHSMPDMLCFMIVMEKCPPTSIHLPPYVDDSLGYKALNLNENLRREKERDYVHNDVLYELEDLMLGAKGNISALEPGRRIKFILGEPGASKFSYYAILLDAKADSGELKHVYATAIIPQIRKHDAVSEIYTIEGQWNYSTTVKASRLLMVILDSSNSCYSMDIIKEDITTLAKHLTPAPCDNPANAPIFVNCQSEFNGIIQRDNYNLVLSEIGPIFAEDVIYKTHYNEDVKKDRKYRRLIFTRFESLVQSEAPLSEKESVKTERASSLILEVDHNFLVSPYHNMVLRGIKLLYPHFPCTEPNIPVKVMILGLGIGVLPMCLKKELSPSLSILVCEVDPVILDVAINHFGFKEDKHLQVLKSNGLETVANLSAITKVAKEHKPDILVVDVQSTDKGSGWRCPGEGYVGEKFLLHAKDALSEDGLLIMNLIPKFPPLREKALSNLKKVFKCHIFVVETVGDPEAFIFAFKTDVSLNKLKDNSKDGVQFSTSLGLNNDFLVKKLC